MHIGCGWIEYLEKHYVNEINDNDDGDDDGGDNDDYLTTIIRQP